MTDINKELREALRTFRQKTLDFNPSKPSNSNVIELDEAIAKIKALVVGQIPKTQSIVTLTEPPQGIDRLWLEGRDYGITAGYNQCLGEIRSIFE